MVNSKQAFEICFLYQASLEFTWELMFGVIHQRQVPLTRLHSSKKSTDITLLKCVSNHTLLYDGFAPSGVD